MCEYHENQSDRFIQTLIYKDIYAVPQLIFEIYFTKSLFKKTVK